MTVCKNPEYSTTRMLVASGVQDNNNQKLETTGGLRIEGYAKVGSPEKPLISVIMAVFNSADVLEHAIRSVIYQQYENVEFIVIDGGSTDGSVDIFKKYNNCIDYWVSEPDDGIYYALNKGIDVSKGDWLYFLGSDDVMINSLHVLTKKFLDPFCVYYGDVYYPSSHKLFGGEFSTYRLMNCQIPHQATFYPRNLFLQHKFNTNYISAADYEFNIVCYNNKKFRYEYLPILVALYEDTSGFSTLDLDKKFHTEKNDLLKKYFSKADYIKYVIRISIKKFDQCFFRKLLHTLKKYFKNR